MQPFRPTRAFLGILGLILLGLAARPAAARVLPGGASAQAFPYLPGFPRLEPYARVDFVSPSVADLDGDGRLEVLVADSRGCVWGWNAQGIPLPQFPWATSGPCTDVNSSRIIGPLAVGDVDGAPGLEVVAGTRGLSNNPGQRGRVYVWSANGTLLPGWPQEMAWDGSGDGQAEVFSVLLADLAGDARLEVVAGTSNNSNTSGATSRNVYAWRADGSLLSPDFPAGYRTAGIYGHIGAAQLTGDGYAEIVAGRDHVYVSAYDAAAQPLPGWPARTYVDPAKTDYNTDMYAEFTSSAPSMGDLDGDGLVETVIAGRVRDPNQARADVASGVFVFEPDGQRRAGWTLPRLGGAPLYDSFKPVQAPSLADLNGDGSLEIVVPLYDGTIRAYRADGSLAWSYDYAQGRRLFASEAAVGDVSGDGRPDVVFGTYSPDGSANSAVGIIGLSGEGKLLPGFPLPLTQEGSGTIQGVRAGPTLADLDGDCHVDLLAASAGGTLYAWDLPAPIGVRPLPWPTARHDNTRGGAVTGPAAPAALRALAGFQVYLPLVPRQVCG